MSNGSLLKQNRLCCMIKVINSLDSVTSGICKNPLLAYSLLNIVAPVSYVRVVSALGATHAH